MIHKLKLEFVDPVTAVDLFFEFFVLADTLSDISVKRRIRKAEIVFVGLAAKPVGGYLFCQFRRKSELATDVNNFRNRKKCKRRNVTRSVAVTRAVSYPVLRKIAGVDNASVI